MKINLLLLAAVLTFVPFASHAVRVPGLYEAEVPVADQQANTRTQAIALAMKIVLIKLTGDRNAPVRPNLAPIINSAEKYMQQYRYVEVPPAFADPLVAGRQLRLRVNFEESNLNMSLRDAGVQVWGRERPSVLLWLAMEKDQIRKLVIPEEEPLYYQVVNREADARGIVLMGPLFDLEDTTSLQSSDIRAGFQDVIINASTRYAPDTILTGWIESPLDGVWEAKWTAYFGKDRETWVSQASFAEAVLNEGVQGMADRLAVRYGSQAGTVTGQTTMKVLDVYTVDQYARVLGYLQALSPVSRVEVIEVNTGNIEFQLTAHGGESAVLQAINFGGVLEPVSTSSNLYRLLP